MKAAADSLVAAALTGKSRVSVVADLVKARLTLLVLLTAMAGFYLGLESAMTATLMAGLLAGTGLLAAGAAALNQWIEQAHDARMHRTQDRPLPSGRLRSDAVFGFGLGASIVGTGILWAFVNPLTSGLGVLTLIIYLLVYTPLKRVTPLNTLVGAIPGALPPLMGWVAARGQIDVEGWVLFAILAFWQVPHFMAIAWMYRDDYARAGFAMLPVYDPTGRRTSIQALLFAAGLCAASLMPWLLDMTGAIYGVVAIVLGLGFVTLSARFFREVSDPAARRLFVGSIVYLPLLLTVMVLNR